MTASLGLHFLQCLPCIHHLVKLLALGIIGLALSLIERLGEPGDHLSIDGVILGKPPGRLSEAANPLRIDDPNLDPGCRSGRLFRTARSQILPDFADTRARNKR